MSGPYSGQPWVARKAAAIKAAVPAKKAAKQDFAKADRRRKEVRENYHQHLTDASQRAGSNYANDYSPKDRFKSAVHEVMDKQSAAERLRAEQNLRRQKDNHRKLLKPNKAIEKRPNTSKGRSRNWATRGAY